MFILFGKQGEHAKFEQWFTTYETMNKKRLELEQEGWHTYFEFDARMSFN